MKIKILIIPFIGLFFTCKAPTGNEQKTATTEVAQVTETSQSGTPSLEKMGYKMIEFIKKEGDCESDTLGCMTILVKYPEITEGDQEVKEKINKHVLKTITSELKAFQSREETEQNIKGIAHNIVNEFKNSTEEYPEDLAQWYIEINMDVSFNTAKIISLVTATESYTGGVHPNSWMNFECFYISNGEKIRLEDIITDIEKLTELAEATFRETTELSHEDDLSEAGFDFKNNTFQLPDNFGFTPDGLVFHYNTYEIAPYVYGPIQIMLSFEKLEGLLVDDISKSED